MISKYYSSLIVLACLFLCNVAYAQNEKLDTIVVSADRNELINIGFGKQPEWMVTSSVSSVTGNKLQKNFTSDLGNTFFGRLSGLTVTQGGGEPGLQSPSLRIRGLNTFGEGKDILVIVDGYELPLGQLVPEEIESAVVLKDASATAIYGSKGANGVLLVTTKRGKEGKLKVNLSVQHGFSSPVRLQQYLGSYDYATLYNEARRNDGLAEAYDATALDAYKNNTDPYVYPNVNWNDEVLRNYAPITNYNLNFNGGNNIVRYFVMLNLMEEEGLYKKTKKLSDFTSNSGLQRFNFRSNVDIQLSDNLSAHLTMGGTIDDKENPADNNTASIFNAMSIVPPNAFPVYNPNGTYGGTNLYSNPWGDILQTGYYTSNGRVFQGTFKLTEKLDMITKGLSVSAAVSFNTTFTSLSNKSREYARYYYSKDATGNPVYTKLGENTSLSGSEGQSDQWRSTAVQAFLNYNRSFGNNLLDGVIFYNNSEYTTGVGGLPYLDRGVFGRMTFANQSKYIAEVSFGYNATDNFPSESRWGLFPAVSLGWVASNEDFLKNSEAIDFLKIRGSYGMTGNDKIGGKRFMFYQDWVSVGNYFFGTTNTSSGSYGEAQIANPEVTWEKQKQWNLGAEATLWKSIDVSLDVFAQDRYDILAQPKRIVPGLLGLTLPDLNVGKVKNSGFEAMVRYNSSKENDLQYFVQVDVWYAKNKIVDNSETVQLFDYLHRSGRPVNQPFLLESIGFFKDEADINNSPKQIFSEVKPGDLKYKDQNNDGIIDQTDFYPSGTTNLPEITAALQSGLTYKGFDLEFVFQAVTNRSVYLSGNYFEAFQNNGKISEFALGRWTPDTKETATYPRLSSVNNLNNYQPSTFWQRDGSFIKLRSLEFGYTLEKGLVKKMGLNQARVFLNGTNLFSIDHVKDTDPETLSGYPAIRTTSLGIKVQF